MTTEKVIDCIYMGGQDLFIHSALRSYLKGNFYNKAFTDEEREIMGYFDDPRIDSSVSLFSPTDPYFQTDESRCCRYTDYAVSQGISPWYCNDDYALYWCDYIQSFPTHLGLMYESVIHIDGSIRYKDINSKAGVRPRIKLDFNN